MTRIDLSGQRFVKQGPYGQRCVLMMTKWLYECVTTWLLTDRWTIRPSYRDAKMNLEGLVFLLWQYFTRKWWFSLFLAKALPTDQQTDRPTDGQTRLWRCEDASKNPVFSTLMRTHLLFILFHSIGFSSLNIFDTLTQCIKCINLIH